MSNLPESSTSTFQYFDFPYIKVNRPISLYCLTLSASWIGIGPYHCDSCACKVWWTSQHKAPLSLSIAFVQNNNLKLEPPPIPLHSTNMVISSPFSTDIDMASRSRGLVTKIINLSIYLVRRSKFKYSSLALDLDRLFNREMRI